MSEQGSAGRASGARALRKLSPQAHWPVGAQADLFVAGDGLTAEPVTGPTKSTTVFTDAPDGAALDVGMALAPGLGLTEPVGVDVGLTDGDGDVGVGVGLGLTDVGVGLGVGLGVRDGCGDGGQVEDGAGLTWCGSGASRLMLSREVSGARGQPVLFNQVFFNWCARPASACPPPLRELGYPGLWAVAAAGPRFVAVCCSWLIASAPEPIITTKAAIAPTARSHAGRVRGSPRAGLMPLNAAVIRPSAGWARPATGPIRPCARSSRRRSQGTASRRRSRAGSVQETIQAAITGRGGVSRARIRPRPSAAGSTESAAARSALRSRSS
jgi:hypothetical protein